MPPVLGANERHQRQLGRTGMAVICPLLGWHGPALLGLRTRLGTPTRARYAATNYLTVPSSPPATVSPHSLLSRSAANEGIRRCKLCASCMVPCRERRTITIGDYSMLETAVKGMNRLEHLPAYYHFGTAWFVIMFHLACAYLKVVPDLVMLRAVDTLRTLPRSGQASPQMHIERAAEGCYHLCHLERRPRPRA